VQVIFGFCFNSLLFDKGTARSVEPVFMVDIANNKFSHKRGFLGIIALTPLL
jgi:hypothetical protein